MVQFIAVNIAIMSSSKLVVILSTFNSKIITYLATGGCKCYAVMCLEFEVVAW